MDLRAAAIRVIAFARFDFRTEGIGRYCSAAFDFPWDDGEGQGTQTYQGLGGLVELSPIRETSEIEATGVRAIFAGFPTATTVNPLALALNTKVQGSPAKIWLGAMTEDYRLIGTPVLEFVGRIDTLEIVEDGPSATMTVNMESRFAAVMRPNNRRMTDRDHQQVYPGDRYFEHLTEMKEKPFVFPSREAQRR